ncbi:hypothetical protein PMAYCL1PPCAC_15311, partial [Pristionchus mayeri]
VAGVILNLVLLYAIRRFTKKALGSYKQLLTIFAGYDVFLTILHSTVKPVREQHVVIVGTTFGVAGIFDDRVRFSSQHFAEQKSQRITSFYASCFTVPFALMNIHFLYRFWSIRRPDLLYLFSVNKFIAFLTFFPIAEFIMWYLMCINGLTGEGTEVGKTVLISETGRRFGKEFKEGWLMMDHWACLRCEINQHTIQESGNFQLQIFVMLMCYNAIMIISFSIASTFGILTFYYIQRTETISMQALNMQLKLFIAVCGQTLVPLIFVYIPYFCVLNLPFFRLPIFKMDDLCMLFTSCFPAWDAIILIVLMKDYRDGLISIIRRKKIIPMGNTVISTLFIASTI